MVPELREGTRPWFFEDVVFDGDAADDAVEELALAATSLGDALALVETDVPVVVEDWEGQARAVFDEEMSAVLAAGHQLLALLLAAGSAVVAASEGARDEQRRREWLRAEAEAAAGVDASGAGDPRRGPGHGDGGDAGDAGHGGASQRGEAAG
jgi:uncharacterized protein YukE